MVGTTTRYYKVGEQEPFLKRYSLSYSIYDGAAQEIIYYLKNEEVDEFEATDRLDVVELYTVDDSDRVDAIFIDGELVGSVDAPFIYPVDQYVNFEKLTELQGIE
jgi:hypothetical protein